MGAEDAFAKYVDKVMRASYPNFKIKLPCCGFDEAKIPQEVVTEVDLQTLRDARHQDECLRIDGKILKCKGCLEPKEFTTQDIVMLSLDYWRKTSTNLGDASLTRDKINSSWLDVAAYTSPIDDLPLPDGCGWLK